MSIPQNAPYLLAVPLIAICSLFLLKMLFFQLCKSIKKHRNKLAPASLWNSGLVHNYYYFDANIYFLLLLIANASFIFFYYFAFSNGYIEGNSSLWDALYLGLTAFNGFDFKIIKEGYAFIKFFIILHTVINFFSIGAYAFSSFKILKGIDSELGKGSPPPPMPPSSPPSSPPPSPLPNVPPFASELEFYYLDLIQDILEEYSNREKPESINRHSERVKIFHEERVNRYYELQNSIKKWESYLEKQEIENDRWKKKYKKWLEEYKEWRKNQK